jgi:uncharacterized protein (DUF4213/DUF364 family)
MTVLDDLLESLRQDAPVRSVLVGAHWTAVCSRGCGLASTLLDDRPHGEAQVRMAGKLTGRTALQLSALARSDSLLEASIGVAAINSLLDVDPTAGPAINAVDVLIERGAGKKVALVGHFPFIPSLRGAAAQLWVLEQHPGTGEHPAEAANDLIPQADVVAITGTTLINHTLESLLALCRPEALVMLLGPSTPLSPILFEHGVSVLSGVRVVDETAALRAIAEGATFRQVQGVALITVSRPGWR